MSTRLAPGVGELPRLFLEHSSGSSAEVYLHGAHVTSWIPADGTEALFLSRSAAIRTGTSIRGGIPVIFPQFAGLGTLPKHGFARVQPWEWVEAESEPHRATLQLRETEHSRRLWPHCFVARLTVELGPRNLQVRLTVRNTDTRPFDFTSALHTYLRVADIRRTAIRGLQGVRFRSAREGVNGEPDPEPQLTFTGEMDRIYLDTPPELQVEDRQGGRTVHVRSAGFQDAVIWNPWAERASQLPDMDADEYLEMVCVEAAQVGVPIRLTPGAEWTGEQRLEI